MRQTVILCDLDADGERREAAEVVHLVMDGEERIIDVCAEHLAVLRALRPVNGNAPGASGGATESASPSASRPRPRASRGTKRHATTTRGKKAAVENPGRRTRQPNSRRAMQERTALIREWARAQGRDVSDRGRLPVGLIEEYESVHR